MISAIAEQRRIAESLKAENEALQQQLAAAREALQAAARLVDKWRDDAELLMKLSDVVIEYVGMARQHDADELAAILQRDRQP